MLRALGVGDLLAAVPALRATRRALPGHSIVLAAPASLAPLARLIDAVDQLHPTSALDAPLDCPSPDVAINLHGRGPQSHQALHRLRPRRMVAFRRDDLGVPGPEWTREEHEARRWRRLVADELDPDDGAALGTADFRLPTPDVPAPADRAVVVHPGAGYPARRWPAERFAAVAARLSAAGWPVVFTGSADERELADQTRQVAGLPPPSVLAGHTRLDQVAALVARARLVICGDTGVAHLATAYGTPSVVLFGPTSPALWGPLGSGPHVALWHGSTAGDPWADWPDPALLEISVKEVLGAACDLLPVT